MHPITRLVPIALAAVLLVGCGRTVGTAPMTAKSKAAAAAAAKSVAPDDAKVIAEDTRRALYWAGDAVRVMAVHTTALNTTAISAAANVFVSADRYHDSQPCVFVARHYGFAAVAQYTQLPDYNRLAFNLKPVPTTLEVTAKAAFNLAKNFRLPAPATPAAGTPAGPNTTEMAARAFVATRAVLLGGDAGSAEWRLYGGDQRFVIDARTQAVMAPNAQVNPNDPLNQGGDVEIQRASMVFLPLNPMQANIQKEPVASN